MQVINIFTYWDETRDKNYEMRRGYIRKVRNVPLDVQHEAQIEAGVAAVYSDPTPEPALKSLREGDELTVYGGLHILAPSRDGIDMAVRMAHERGAVVLDLKTGRSTAGDGVSMFADAMREIANDKRRGLKDGRLGAQARWGDIKRLAVSQALEIWFDKSLTVSEKLEKMDGWTRASAYRHLGTPGNPAGRRTADREPNKATVGRIYFVQRPSNGRIKIGFSKTVLKRIKALNHDEILAPLLTIRGTREDEKALHRQFAEYRVRGEWFEPGEKLMEFIASKERKK